VLFVETFWANSRGRRTIRADEKVKGRDDGRWALGDSPFGGFPSGLDLPGLNFFTAHQIGVRLSERKVRQNGYLIHL
jgi:hypothetical protein